MSVQHINVKRTDTVLRPDESRVLLRPFHPGDSRRAANIIARVMILSESRVSSVLTQVYAEFQDRHQQIKNLLEERFEQVRHHLLTDEEISRKRRQLIGAYFVLEFSLESAALFNPSIVPHPDQSGLPSGSLRFVMSLRATGEGHLSSITFRVGILSLDHQIRLEPSVPFVTEPQQIPNSSFEKELFGRKLYELDLANDFSRQIVDRLEDFFSMQALRSSIDKQLKQVRGLNGAEEHKTTAEGIWMLARSNYAVKFHRDQELSGRVIFPCSPSQSGGIEDARFVLFQNDDGSQIYYATFTAYNGQLIVPELLETEDFLHFRCITLNGPAAQNKDMAMFPRKINGLYAMLSRQDNENIYLMFSDNVHFWYEPKLLLKPTYPWELVQMGNCSSPIETESGWLVLSHGVGPMRKYCLGAFLLDRDDPSQVIGRLREPLLKPNEDEREGYVPNVVYTCGALLHEGELIIPYAMSDRATGICTVALDELLVALR